MYLNTCMCSDEHVDVDVGVRACMPALTQSTPAHLHERARIQTPKSQ